MLIISFGHPNERKACFRDCLPFDKYLFEYCQKNLSQMAQLINIMRSNSLGKPLNEMMKNKIMLLKTILDFA